MKWYTWALLGLLVLAIIYLIVKTKTTLTLKINKKCTYKTHPPMGGAAMPPKVLANWQNTWIDAQGIMMNGVCGPDPDAAIDMQNRP